MNSFYILFMMIFTGIILRRLRVIDDRLNDGLNKIILYISLPCLLIKTMGELHPDREMFIELMTAVMVSSALVDDYLHPLL